MTSEFCETLYIGTIGATNLFANLIVIDMISAEKTGAARKVYLENRGYWVIEYEIKVEWYMDAPESVPTELDLYRRSSPGAYPNGTLIGSDVEAYYESRYWDWLYQSWRIYSEYRHYNWVQSGTWYYMAEHSAGEVSETVP